MEPAHYRDAMSRGHLVFSIAATAWAAAIGACSLLSSMMGLPEAILLLASVPAILALLWDFRSRSSTDLSSLPGWARLLRYAGLAAAVPMALGLFGSWHYSLGGSRADLARFAPVHAAIGVWFGYNAVLHAWAKLRQARAGHAAAMP